ncbi:uncharacterized protein LOC102800932 [Saccoglossus kowalevskii]|uniref:Uncharacterized protein LOC102800932 n=1 Tax=Saccoglossus kowalevskii TaxID=10224 RepID=A0ABM0MEU8_SACKO|nr:PREDICTED: uncharacterized protein LOC102800932 [Saccoglossus kowalevskii]
MFQKIMSICLTVCVVTTTAIYKCPDIDGPVYDAILGGLIIPTGHDAYLPIRSRVYINSSIAVRESSDVCAEAKFGGGDYNEIACSSLSTVVAYKTWYFVSVANLTRKYEGYSVRWYTTDGGDKNMIGVPTSLRVLENWDESIFITGTKTRMTSVTFALGLINITDISFWDNSGDEVFFLESVNGDQRDCKVLRRKSNIVPSLHRGYMTVLLSGLHCGLEGRHRISTTMKQQGHLSMHLDIADNIQITAHIVKYPTKYGSEAIVECTTDETRYQTSWFKDGIELQNEVIIISTNNGSRLYIENFQPINRGLYTCLVECNCDVIESRRIHLTTKGEYASQCPRQTPPVCSCPCMGVTSAAGYMPITNVGKTEGKPVPRESQKPEPIKEKQGLSQNMTTFLIVITVVGLSIPIVVYVSGWWNNRRDRWSCRFVPREKGTPV